MIKFINKTNTNPIPDLFVVVSRNDHFYVGNGAAISLKAISNENSMCSHDKTPIVMIDYDEKRPELTMMV
jgi:hypothetical protein